jgi:hypothetical protein
MKPKPKDITFHYTKEQMVKDLLAITPISGSSLDAGSGRNKVWYNNLKGEKYECELEEGCDFLLWDKPVDWVVGNPPFHISKDFFDKAVGLARKGIAFLINTQAFNSITPKRLQGYADKGFFVSRVIVVSDKRWYGRYYYIILTKDQNEFIQWKTKTY